MKNIASKAKMALSLAVLCMSLGSLHGGFVRVGLGGAGGPAVLAEDFDYDTTTIGDLKNRIKELKPEYHRVSDENLMILHHGKEFEDNNTLLKDVARFDEMGRFSFMLRSGRAAQPAAPSVLDRLDGVIGRIGSMEEQLARLKEEVQSIKQQLQRQHGQE